MTVELARALPGLFVAKAAKLHMEPGTPETGVQVTHKKFHGRDVNAPDMWVLIQFIGEDLTEVQQTKVTGRVKKLLLGWFRENDYTLPVDYACDIRWSPSHGFLRIDGIEVDW